MNMTEQIEYIKFDRYFMNHVSCCCDRYQIEDIYQIDALKDDFQKVLDVVKPIKTERACTDAEKEKYHLSYHKDIQNALEYEQCYTLLLDLVSDYTTYDKVDFLYPYVPYLRGILNIASAVDDNWIFKRYCHNQIIAYLLVYRYENKISILDDLHMELSRKAVDLFWVELSQQLSDQRFQKILELQRNHPEEYRKKKDEKKKFFLQNMDYIRKLAEMRGISIKRRDE